MATINDFQKQIYKTIDIITEEKLKSLGFDKTSKGKVVSVGLNDCRVQINNEIFTCKVKVGDKVTIGEVVYVKIPQNKDSEKYIDAVMKTGEKQSYNMLEPIGAKEVGCMILDCGTPSSPSSGVSYHGGGVDVS